MPIKNPKDYFYPVTTSYKNNNNDLLFIENFNHFEKELTIIFQNLFDEKTSFFANDSE